MVTPQVPDELLGPVVAYFNPRRVILFGSMATHAAGPDSDINLFVIVDDDTPAEKLTLAAGHEARSNFKGAADIVPCRERTFLSKSEIAGTLAYDVARDGVVIWEK